MLDINYFRVDKNGTPETVRESQRRRFSDETIVDDVIFYDSEWRKFRSKLDNLNRSKTRISKVFSSKKKKQRNNNNTIEKMQFNNDDSNNSFLPEHLNQKLDSLSIDEDLELLTWEHLKRLSQNITQERKRVEQMMITIAQRRDEKLWSIGNIVDNRCPISKDEKDNIEIGKWSPINNNNNNSNNNNLNNNNLNNNNSDNQFKIYSNIVLMRSIGGLDTVTGTKVSGHRGYFIQGDLLLLQLGLYNYAIQFLLQREYKPIQPSVIMKHDLMSRVAQLEDFEEQLYAIDQDISSKENSNPDLEKKNNLNDTAQNQYLIATSEQPICAKHAQMTIDPSDLPFRYAGMSPCFRKEAGNAGRDTLGLFRVHQFDKVEQFCVTSPETSWDIFEEMMSNAESFYQSLEIPYRKINIVSGKLNKAAACKYDLEAWFPSKNRYRELVSCSNCTDYQSRRLQVRLSRNKGESSCNSHPHMLNATLCAVQRTLCCIVENYQCEEGIRVPGVLVPFVGRSMIPFIISPLEIEKKMNS